jgi:hypothetical protein
MCRDKMKGILLSRDASRAEKLKSMEIVTDGGESST